MKKILMLLALTLTMSMLLISCSDDEKPTGPSEPNMKLGDFSAKVNDYDWKVEKAVFYNSSKILSGVKIDTTDPFNRVRKMISINLTTDDATPEVKTYTAICFYKESTGSGVGEKEKFWMTDNGICKISKVTDKEITGTFSFSAFNEEEVSTKIVEASFYVPIE